MPTHPPGGPLADVVKLHPIIHRHRRDLLHRDPDRFLREREEKMRKHHERHLWAPVGVMLLGAVLLVHPALMVYPESSLAWSDRIAGALLVVFGALSLSPDRLWAPWASAAVGMWLLVAPVIFRTGSAGLYNTDTFGGIAALSLSLLIPGIPGTLLLQLRGPEVPTGWNFSPSSWWQRLPVLFLSFAAFLICRYLAAWELSHIAALWEPLHPERSATFRSVFPLYALGSVGFLLLGLLQFVGGTSRWRSVPWAALASAVLPFLLAVWCWTAYLTEGWGLFLPLVVALLGTLCLPFGLDEGRATTQFLQYTRREGASVRRVVWMGGTVGQVSADRLSPRLMRVSAGLRTLHWGLGVGRQALGFLVGATLVVLGTSSRLDENWSVLLVVLGAFGCLAGATFVGMSKGFGSARH